MRRYMSLAVVVIGSLIVAACTHNVAGGPGSDASFIDEPEIDSLHAVTAYDVIHKLRPQYLISRGKLSLDPRVPPALPRVYVDDQFYGEATELRGIMAATIQSIRWYSAGAAQQKYGHDNAAGVIAITTKH